jgi:N-acetyl-anhydromuramyl-L-alanine amidase AmpD
MRTRMFCLTKTLVCIYLLTGCTHNQIIRNESVNQNSRVRYVVIHFTSETFTESLKSLTEDSSRPVSSHYLIPSPNDATYSRSKILIHQLVDETQRAWHAGRSYWHGEENLNDSSVGIEIVNISSCEPANQGTSEYDDESTPLPDCDFKAYPEEQIALLVKLLTDILTRNPDIATINIVGHADIAPNRKVDPGPLFPWENLHNLGIGPWPDPQMTAQYQQLFEPDLPRLLLLQKALNTLGYQIQETGVNDLQSRLAVRAFQFHFRPMNPSGLFDTESAAILYALIDRYRNEQLDSLLIQPE